MNKFSLMVAILAMGFHSMPAVGANIAVLNSDQSRAYFGVHYRYCPATNPDPYVLGSSEYDRYVGGWEKVLRDKSLAYHVIHDHDVTDAGLAPYTLLILANSPSLSKEETKAIQKWVIHGGRLLATFGSGYEGVLPADSSYLTGDLAKLQEGGTNGLHQLWHDPLSKIVTTAEIELNQFGASTSASEKAFEKTFCGGTPVCGIEPRITKFSGPTAELSPDHGFSYEQITGYGDNANVLIQRPEQDKEVFGFLEFRRNIVDTDTSNDVQRKKNLPAIIANEQAKGRVVYFSFAPEFIVGLEFDVAGHCVGDPNYGPGPSPVTPNAYTGRSTQLEPLMKSALDYLLAP